MPLPNAVAHVDEALGLADVAVEASVVTTKEAATAAQNDQALADLQTMMGGLKVK